jgi:hypothetical protein
MVFKKDDQASPPNWSLMVSRLFKFTLQEPDIVHDFDKSWEPRFSSMLCPQAEVLYLSITTHHAHRHTEANNKETYSPIKAQLLHPAVHTCPKTKTVGGSCPGNISNTPGEKAGTLALPETRLARLYTQRTGAGLASLRGTRALPGLVSGVISHALPPNRKELSFI